jgi:glutamate-1-semialdehyde 2,1-aminomutase
MTAIRLARGFTGREAIVKFDGCYHGHADSLLVSAGSGVATLGIPGSPGVPKDLAAKTFTLPYNDVEAARRLLAERGKEIACLLVEPVAANMGVVLPKNGFLEELRQLTQQHGILLIFDEVITGFRMSLGGAQAVCGLRPDLTILGKILGGGLPIGAYGGRREIMDQIAPLGPIYQAGTLSGNPLACAAGLETLSILEQLDPYEGLNSKAEALAEEIRRGAKERGIPVTVNQAGSLLTAFFCEPPVENYAQAKQTDTRLFSALFHQLLKKGIYLPPSNFEALFICVPHSWPVIEQTAAAFREAILGLN